MRVFLFALPIKSRNHDVFASTILCIKVRGEGIPKKLELFAIGCSKCRLMEVATATAIDELGMNVQVEKVQDTMEMRERGVQS